MLLLLVHACAFSFAYFASYALGAILLDPYYRRLFWLTLPAIVAIKLAIFFAQGNWRRGWRYATFSDLAALLRATTLSLLVIATVDMLYRGYNLPNIPRRILLLDWGMTILTLGGLRVVWRLSREEYRTVILSRGCRKALIVGATPAGESLARQFLQDDDLNYLAAGFLDDDASRYGSKLGGVPILGSPDDAISIAERRSADLVLVLSGQLTGVRLRKLMEACKEAELSLKIIPAMDDLLRGEFAVQMRDVDIDDLLRREPVELSDEAISDLIEDRVVMVTGAGGSIGSEICRQVLKFAPRRILLVERSENGLFHLEQEFSQLPIHTHVVPCLADVGDSQRMNGLFAKYRPQVVFHAAAHKHVPMIEANPGEAITNNVATTRLMAELSNEYEVGEFVLISTDKSVNPTSMMGASKQIAERYVHALSEQATTKFIVVRFGNVLASAGSVVPLFQQQIRQGGPVTVTHPDMQRFFMTIPEASQLVLQAAAMGRGGEIYVLDMGDPVRIVDLAKDLIRLSGMNEDDIEIRYTGLRPGEKLYEELYFDDEQRLPTPHPKLFVAYHRPFDLSEVRSAVENLIEQAHVSDDALRAKVQEIVPEYRYSEPDATNAERSAASSLSVKTSEAVQSPKTGEPRAS